MFEFRANFVDSYWLNLNKNWKIMKMKKMSYFFLLVLLINLYFRFILTFLCLQAKTTAKKTRTKMKIVETKMAIKAIVAPPLRRVLSIRRPVSTPGRIETWIWMDDDSRGRPESTAWKFIIIFLIIFFDYFCSKSDFTSQWLCKLKKRYIQSGSNKNEKWTGYP